MNSHKKMITNLRSFSFGFYTNHNIWSFFNNTSHFEIGTWNFWCFNIENKPLAFWAPCISIKSRFPFFLVKYSMCDGFCSSLSLFILRFTFVELFKKKKIVGRDIGTSLCMYQNQQNYWPIIHDKLEDWFTIVIDRFHDFPT